MYTHQQFRDNQRAYFWFGIAVGVVSSFLFSAASLWVIGYLN